MLSIVVCEGVDPGFGFGGSAGHRYTWGRVWGVGVPLLIGEASGDTGGFFSFLGLEMRILVHSLAHLRIYFCTVIRPGPDLQYACPL